MLMAPDLSRRLAAAVNSLTIPELSRHARVQLAREAQPADIFDELPQWIKNVVEKAEAS